MKEKNLEEIKSNPYISVIITAHDRRQYIIDAIKSALNQTLDRSLYEIIVVKYFKDEEIDKFIEENNIKNIYTDEIELGKKLVTAIEIARGEIISFLEDDDKFYPEKLEITYEIFKDNKDVRYYHHHTDFVDKNGKKVKPAFKTPIKFMKYSKISSLKEFLILQGYGFDYSMSCISIRKDSIISYLNDLREMYYAVDCFIFFASTSIYPNFILDNRVLTVRLIHESLSKITNKNFEYYKTKRLNIEKINYEAYKILINKFQNTLWKDFIYYRYLEIKIRLYLLGENNLKLSNDELSKFFKFIIFNLNNLFYTSNIIFVIYLLSTINFKFSSIYVKLEYKWHFK